MYIVNCALVSMDNFYTFALLIAQCVELARTGSFTQSLSGCYCTYQGYGIVRTTSGMDSQRINMDTTTSLLNADSLGHDEILNFTGIAGLVG